MTRPEVTVLSPWETGRASFLYATPCESILFRHMFMKWLKTLALVSGRVLHNELNRRCSCTYCRCKSSRQIRGDRSKRTTWFRPTRFSVGKFLHCDTEKTRKDPAGRTPHTCCGLSVFWTPLCPRPGFLVFGRYRTRTSRGKRCTERWAADVSKLYEKTWKPCFWKMRGQLSQFPQVRNEQSPRKRDHIDGAEACVLHLASCSWAADPAAQEILDPLVGNGKPGLFCEIYVYHSGVVLSPDSSISKHSGYLS